MTAAAPTTSATAVEPYALVMRPLLFEKVWGGRSLASLGKNLPPGDKIGESWELADMGSTSASARAAARHARSLKTARWPGAQSPMRSPRGAAR
ncbi:MAG: hypothetical protein QM783_17450 [Phycisphaerales bacterium]